MSYSYVSLDGKRTQGVFATKDEAKRAKSDPAFRRELRAYLGKGYLLRHEATSTPAIQDDFPEHFSVSFDTVVRSRRHHRQLQKERGTHDYEPCRDSVGSNLSRQALERDRKQRRYFYG